MRVCPPMCSTSSSAIRRRFSEYLIPHPGHPQDLLHRLHGDRQAARCGCAGAHMKRSDHGAGRPMRPPPLASSFTRTPIWRRPSRCSRPTSTAMPGQVCVSPTRSSCLRACSTSSSTNSYTISKTLNVGRWPRPEDQHGSAGAFAQDRRDGILRRRCRGQGRGTLRPGQANGSAIAGAIILRSPTVFTQPPDGFQDHERGALRADRGDPAILG